MCTARVSNKLCSSIVYIHADGVVTIVMYWYIDGRVCLFSAFYIEAFMTIEGTL